MCVSVTNLTVCMFVCLCLLCAHMCVTLCPTSWQERPAGSGGALDPKVSITDLDWQTRLLCAALTFTHTLSLSGLHSVTLSGWLSFTPSSCLCRFPPLSPFFFFFVCLATRVSKSTCCFQFVNPPLSLFLPLFLCLSLSPSLLSSFSQTDGRLKPFLALLSQYISLFFGGGGVLVFSTAHDAVIHACTHVYHVCVLNISVGKFKCIILLIYFFWLSLEEQTFFYLWNICMPFIAVGALYNKIKFLGYKKKN